MKIIINDCYGGFNISIEAVKLARQISNNPNWGGCVLAGEKYSDGTTRDINCPLTIHRPDVKRTDKVLVRVVEELGEEANGSCSQLSIVELPDGSKYRINEYDGRESIETPDDIHWETD